MFFHFLGNTVICAPTLSRAGDKISGPVILSDKISGRVGDEIKLPSPGSGRIFLEQPHLYQTVTTVPN